MNEQRPAALADRPSPRAPGRPGCLPAPAPLRRVGLFGAAFAPGSAAAPAVVTGRLGAAVDPPGDRPLLEVDLPHLPETGSRPPGG